MRAPNGVKEVKNLASRGWVELSDLVKCNCTFCVGVRSAECGPAGCRLRVVMHGESF